MANKKTAQTSKNPAKSTDKPSGAKVETTEKSDIPVKKAAPAAKKGAARKAAPDKKAAAQAAKPKTSQKTASETAKPAAGPAKKAPPKAAPEMPPKKAAAGNKAVPSPKTPPKAPEKKPKPAAAKKAEAVLAGKAEAAAPAPAASAPAAVEVIKYLEDLDRFGMKLGLTRIEKLLKALGSPEQKLKTIHIVGSNGKSSTARMISAILGAHGIKAGAYLSPHLVSFNERFLINGKEISDQRFEKLILDVREVAEDVNKRSRSSGPLTQFEILTAAAFLYFNQQKVDVAVMEAGLGGRFDATNVVESKVQVLTNVELEHTDVLGGTVAEIVREKAAIIPEKGNVVLGALSEEALDEAVRICKRKKAKYLTFGEDFSLLKGRGDKFDVWTEKGQYGDLTLTLFGQYQRTNCAVALQAAELFTGQALDEKKLRRALPRITIPARMEVISEKPMIILDGAHNPAGIDQLLTSLRQMAPSRRTICVVSILEDKDAEKMLGRLLDFCDILFITENSNPRCARAQELANLPVVKSSPVQTFVARESQSALESAFKLASIRDVILVTGSLYLMSDIKKRM